MGYREVKPSKVIRIDERDIERINNICKQTHKFAWRVEEEWSWAEKISHLIDQVEGEVGE